MPEYIAHRDTWLSHENRSVKAGETFTTEFPPGPGGKPMVLSGNIELVKPARGKAAEKVEPDGGALV